MHGTTTIQTPEATHVSDTAPWQGTRCISIISAVRNRREITLQCLRSLDRVDRTGLVIDPIIIDDASTDGTSDAISESFPDVRIIHGTGDLWCSGAVNLGVELALEGDPDYILVLNDDTVFDSEFLRSMIATAEASPKSVVGALLLDWCEPHRVFQVAPRWKTCQGGWQHWQQQTVWTVPDHPFDVELIVGNCTLFPAAAFRQEGLFATRWLPHYGDAEFTPRLRKRGWRLLIDPHARVFNQPNEEPPKMSKMSMSELYDVVW
ncbi:MAG: glycosyltransferase family 2 protein [Acidobacteria bacterium]|nr:glycosyltransferase family 2 protein [Acidobacteriota bacterium]